MTKIFTLILCLLSALSLADTPAPNKAFVNDGAGNPITSTVVGSKRGLDVSLASGVTFSGGLAITSMPPVVIASQPIAVTISSQPLSVTGPLTDGQLRASGVPVTGNFFPAIQPVSGTGIFNIAASSAVPVSGTFFQTTQPVSGVGTFNIAAASTVPVSIASLPPVVIASQPISVTGTVTANAGTGIMNVAAASLPPVTIAGTVNVAASSAIPVSIATLPPVTIASQPISVTGPLTDGQLRASAVPVSGTFFQGTQPVSISGQPIAVTISSQPITVTTGGLTDAQLRASAVPVSGAFTVASLPPITIASQPIAVTIASLPSVVVSGGVAVTNVPTVVANAGTGIMNVAAASLPLPSGAATSANQTNGSQKTQVVDGSGNVQGPMQALAGTNYAPVTLAASGSAASAVPAKIVFVGGTDGTNLRGLSTDTSGNVNVNVISNSGTSHTEVNLVRIDYASTPVTTSAYTQLIASTADTTSQIFIFESGGQTLFLATGAAASESNKYYIAPGGNGLINLNIPLGTRISVKAASTAPVSGELSLSFLK